MAESLDYANRWRSLHLTGLLRGDVLEFSTLCDVVTIRLSVELLPDRVDSPMSLASLARDLYLLGSFQRRQLFRWWDS